MSRQIMDFDFEKETTEASIFINGFAQQCS